MTFTLYSAYDEHVGPPWLAKGLPPCSVDGPVLRDAQRNIIPLTSVIRVPIQLFLEAMVLEVRACLRKSRFALGPQCRSPPCLWPNSWMEVRCAGLTETAATSNSDRTACLWAGLRTPL